jgi:hypothetical protein
MKCKKFMVTAAIAALLIAIAYIALYYKKYRRAGVDIKKKCNIGLSQEKK